MRPAGAAVLWYVLVACGADVVDAVDVSPVPCFGELFYIHIFIRTWSSPEEHKKKKIVQPSAHAIKPQLSLH